MKNTSIVGDVKPEQIAAVTPGFTGADFANLLNKVALLATRRGTKAVRMMEFTAGKETP